MDLSPGVDESTTLPTSSSTSYHDEPPRPGKLDLTQFDNITNAIGKLSVQSKRSSNSNAQTASQPNHTLQTTRTISESQQNIQHSATSQVEHNSDGSGFFKSRPNAKTKPKAKDLRQNHGIAVAPPQLPNHSSTGLSSKIDGDNVDKNSSPLSQKHKSREDLDISLCHDYSHSPIAQRIINDKNKNFQDSKLSKSSSPTDSDHETSTHSKALLQPSQRVHVSSSNLDTIGHMFGSQSGDLKKSHGEAIKLFDKMLSQKQTQLPNFAQKPLPGKLPSFDRDLQQQQHHNESENSSYFMNRTKAMRPRAKELRQNHGIAVLPPQLPLYQHSDLGSSQSTNPEGATNPLPSRYNRHSQLTPTTDSEHQSIDFSQSPIAQRVLKHSKDQRVSELNSPSENELEAQSQPKALPRTNKLVSQVGTSSSSTNLDQHDNPSSRLTPNQSNSNSGDLMNNRNETKRLLNEMLANMVSGPPNHMGPPRLPGRQASFNHDHDRHSQYYVNHHHHIYSMHNNNNDHQTSEIFKQHNDNKNKDKDKEKDKKEKKKSREEEKKRLKEEERLKRQEKKANKSKAHGKSPALTATSLTDGVPYFVRRCIEFIESEGLDAEGIYRVPGNRAHVDTFVQKFKENPEMSISECDIPVNAVATALKDFLSKKISPIVPSVMMDELTDLASDQNVADKDDLAMALRKLINKLPESNYKLLKFLFDHFVKVSLNHSLNSMDSKNLAICWWPTLLPLNFSDMLVFERMRPHLEESIQTMIDRYEIIFDSETPRTLS